MDDLNVISGEDYILSTLLELNESMEQAANTATNRAFNLGCSAGLIPALLVVLLTYLVSGSGWLGAAVMAVLMTLGLILFSNMVASISRTNTLKRIFGTEISLQLKDLAIEKSIELSEIARIGMLHLPDDAVLTEFLPGLTELN